MALMAGTRLRRREAAYRLIGIGESAATKLQRMERESAPVEPSTLTHANGESARLISEHKKMKALLDILNVGVDISTGHLADYLECLDERKIVAHGSYSFKSLQLLEGRSLSSEEFSRLGLIVLHYDLGEEDTLSLVRLYSRFKTGQLIQMARRAANIHQDVEKKLSPLLVAAHRYSQRESCMPEFQRLLRVFSLNNEGILANLIDNKAEQ